jgi:HSP20 family protein
MSKAKEKTNGTDQKGTAVAERASARADSEQSVSAHQNMPAPGSRWDDPSPAERRFADELDRYLETFRLGSNLLANWPAALRRGFGSGDTAMTPEAWTPLVEVFQRGDRIIIRADLPGVSNEDIHVEMGNDEITIQGERRQEHEESREDYFHSERSYGRFFRHIRLPEGIEVGKAEATFRHGVLEITIPAPRREKSQRRRLEVNG